MPSRDELVEAWGDHVLGRLRPKPKALFQAGRFVRVEDKAAIFGLPNDIHRNRCEEVRPDVEAALAEHFGRPVPLRLVVDDGGGPPPPSVSPVSGTGSAPGMPAGETPAADDDEEEDLSVFDDMASGPVVAVDDSAQARVLQAFPGAEEVG